MRRAVACELAGLRLEVRAGAGPPVLLLHGFTGAPAAWGEVLRRLPGDPLSVAPWLPGHGAAPAAPPPASWRATVDALAAVLEAVDARPWGLVGYSMGGRLALDLARRRPARTRWVVAVGARPGLAGAAAREARRRADAAWARLLREQGLAAFLARWRALPMWGTQRHLPAAVRARQRRWRSGHRAEGLAAALEMLGPAAMPDLGARLRQLTVPVCLVVGEHDATYRALAARMARRLPCAEVRVVPGVGHNVPLEAPAAVADAIDAADAEWGETA